MDSALVSLILITLVLFGVLTLSDSYFATQDAILVATEVRTAFTEDRTRTNFTLVRAETLNGGTTVELTIKNSGSTKLADFEQWDLLLQYYTATGTYLTDWYPYAAGSSPGDNQWSVVGIYLSAATAATERYEPEILNPGEELLVRVNLSPAVGPGTTNLITFGVANGVTLSAIFAGE
jgi:hypothetical protein